MKETGDYVYRIRVDLLTCTNFATNTCIIQCYSMNFGEVYEYQYEYGNFYEYYVFRTLNAGVRRKYFLF